jgi:hypothetical protein
MRVVVLAVALSVLYRVLSRRLWRRWRYYGATELPADLVRRSQ